MLLIYKVVSYNVILCYLQMINHINRRMLRTELLEFLENTFNILLNINSVIYYKTQLNEVQ